MEGKWVQEPLGLRFVETRPSLTRKFRPRSLQLRQSNPPPAEDVSDSESDSDDDGLDSPSPTTSSFPASATSGSGSETLPDGANPSGITSRPVAQDGIDPMRTAQAPTMAIAFGIVGAASIVLCIGVAIWWLCRRSRKKKRASQQPSIATTQNPPVDPRYMQQANIPPDHPDLRRTPSSLMGELMAVAYDVENGDPNQQRYTQTPQGYLDEKRYDPNQQLPILQPAPVAQPVVSESIASWVRRHNPLKLNPVNGRTSVYSTAGTVTPRDVAGHPAPPVPAVPPVYQSRELPGDDDKEFLVPPALAVPARVASSNYSNQDQNQSPVSVYGRNSGSWFNREHQPQQQQQQQNAFNPRAPSMAMTERTESTWASWGGGVSRPQYQPDMPPETQRKAWIEKCVRLGGLR